MTATDPDAVRVGAAGAGGASAAVEDHRLAVDEVARARPGRAAGGRAESSSVHRGRTRRARPRRRTRSGRPRRRGRSRRRISVDRARCAACGFRARTSEPYRSFTRAILGTPSPPARRPRRVRDRSVTGLRSLLRWPPLAPSDCRRRRLHDQRSLFADHAARLRDEIARLRLRERYVDREGGRCGRPGAPATPRPKREIIPTVIELSGRLLDDEGAAPMTDVTGRVLVTGGSGFLAGHIDSASPRPTGRRGAHDGSLARPARRPVRAALPAAMCRRAAASSRPPI